MDSISSLSSIISYRLHVQTKHSNLSTRLMSISRILATLSGILFAHYVQMNKTGEKSVNQLYIVPPV